MSFNQLRERMLKHMWQVSMDLWECGAEVHHYNPNDPDLPDITDQLDIAEARYLLYEDAFHFDPRPAPVTRIYTIVDQHNAIHFECESPDEAQAFLMDFSGVLGSLRIQEFVIQGDHLVEVENFN